MAKKLVKRQPSKPKPMLYLGLFILIVFIAVIIFLIVRDSMSGEVTLVDYTYWSGSLALWSGILLRYLGWMEAGGDKWEKPLTIGSWVAFLLMLLFLGIYTFLGLSSAGD